MDEMDEIAVRELEHLERLAAVFSGLVSLGVDLADQLDEATRGLLDKTTTNVAEALHGVSTEVKTLFQDED